jgi:hypothetical protein
MRKGARFISRVLFAIEVVGSVPVMPHQEIISWKDLRGRFKRMTLRILYLERISPMLACSSSTYRAIPGPRIATWSKEPQKGCSEGRCIGFGGLELFVV